MTEVQHKYLNRALILLAILALVFSFTAKIESINSRTFGAIWNLGHIVAFYLWTYLCVTRIKSLLTLSFYKQIILVFVVSILIGAAIEVVQTQVGREAQISDIVSDVLGAMLALLIHAPNRKQLTSVSLWGSRAIIAFMIVYMHGLIIIIPINEYYTHRQFPVLLDPDTPFDSTRLSGNTKRQLHIDPSTHEKAFEIVFNTDLYSIVSVEYFPVNWSGYELLQIDLFNPSSAELWLTCRIHDLEHLDDDQEYQDRFNRRVKLSPGENSIQFRIQEIIEAPVNRDMDITRMAAIGLFTIQLMQPEKIHLGEIKLLK